MAGFIDTDIGSDVDDTLAILYASVHINIAGITTVHACSGKRAKIVKKVFQEIKEAKQELLKTLEEII